MDHHCTTQNERDFLALPVRLGRFGIINPSRDADLQCQVSMKTTEPLVKKIVFKSTKHQMTRLLAHYSRVCKERKMKCFEQKWMMSTLSSLTLKTQHAVASCWTCFWKRCIWLADSHTDWQNRLYSEKGGVLSRPKAQIWPGNHR